MAELEIRSNEDLKKLQGWTIQDTELSHNENGVLILRLLISHPAAEKKVNLIAVPFIAGFKIEIGNVTPIPGLIIRSIDAEEQTK